jgi:tetratricopeptide (TPR) repeat protein
MAFGDMVIAKSHYDLRVLEESSTTSRNTARATAALEQGFASMSAQQSEMIASNARVAESNQALSGIMSEVGSTLGVLVDISSDSLYELRLQSRQLSEVLDTMKIPRRTQADELRGRGLEALSNGWLGEARRDFAEAAELNPYDFTSYQALGDISLREGVYQQAETEFDSAVRYASPYSAVDTGYALLSVAKSREAREDFPGALAKAREGLELDPVLPETLFAVGKYSIACGDVEPGIGMLMTSFWYKPALTVVAGADPTLALHPAELAQALDRFRAQLSGLYHERADQLATVVGMTRELTWSEFPLRKVVDRAVGRMKRSDELASRNSIADLLEALVLQRDAANSLFGELDPLVQGQLRAASQHSQALGTGFVSDAEMTGVPKSAYSVAIVGAIPAIWVAFVGAMVFKNIPVAGIVIILFALGIVGAAFGVGYANGMTNRKRGESQREAAKAVDAWASWRDVLRAERTRLDWLDHRVPGEKR